MIIPAKLLDAVLNLFPLFDTGAVPGAFQASLDPAASFPPRRYRIHPGYSNRSNCVDVKGAQFTNGTPVQL